MGTLQINARKIAVRGAIPVIYNKHTVYEIALSLVSFLGGLALNLFKIKLIDLIERAFNREGSSYLECNDRNAVFTLEKLKYIMHGLFIMYVLR